MRLHRELRTVTAALCLFAAATSLRAAERGDPQYPDLLKIYPVRPPWAVAGVDFPVGVPAGTILKAPETITQPGVAVETSHKYVAVSANDVVLDGYDFKGWEVELLAGATRLTIRNSRFQAGPTQKQAPIYAFWGGFLTLVSNTIDGNGPHSAVNPLVFLGSEGALIEHNLFEHVPDDAINTSHDGRFVIQKNLFTHLNYGAGHTDCVQTFFTPISQLKVAYNTVFQPPPDEAGFPGGGNAFVRVGDERGHTIRRLEIDHNTLVYRGTPATRFANVFDISADGGQVLQPAVHDNYIDPQGVVYGIWSPYVAELIEPIYSGNIDLQSGRPILAGISNSQTVGIPGAAPRAPERVAVSRNSAGLKLSGLAAPAHRVVVSSDGPLATTHADSAGRWTATLPAPSPASVTISVVDPAGNASAPLVRTLDLSAPKVAQ